MNKPTDAEKAKNPNWGGSRKNAGRKKKYGEPTVVVTFRVPASKVDAIKEAMHYFLNNQN